ncbi:MAG: GAF domain-containing sensor histidine kinase [Chloroflexi bacterium]|nr:GAF domain-containing sensor histidine kinase [Chloroflexota bacterium]
MLNISHLTEFLTNLPLLQMPSSLLQSALNEGLRIARTQTGLIAFFDYEEGREAGDDIQLLRQFFALEAARSRAAYNRDHPNGNGTTSQDNPLTLWLPRIPTIKSMNTQQGPRRVLVLPMQNPNTNQANGFIMLLLPLAEKEAGTSDLNINAEELSALISFCRAVSNAWYSLRYLTNVSRRLEDLVLLNEIATAITSNRNLADLLQQIMTTTNQLLRSGACVLLLMDQQSDELVYQMPAGENGETREIRQPAGSGIPGYVARLGEPVIVNDVARDPRFTSYLDEAMGFKTRNVMCAPLIAHETIIGVLAVMNKLDKGAYNSNDMALLTTLAAQGAVAIENAQLYAELSEERDRLIAKEEDVRRDLGRDLHDGPAQVVSGIAMRLAFIKKLLENEPERVMEKLDEAEKVALTAAKDIRTMMFGLRPLMLETKGLIPTLEAYVEKLQTDPWKTHLEVSGFGEDKNNYLRLEHNIEATVFIIIQEAVNNIRKHAAPRNVWIALDHSKESTTVMVRDDGKGFDSRAVTDRYDERGSFGLLNMRERARLIGASYDLFSQPGQGTTILLTIHHGNQRVLGDLNMRKLTTGSLSASSLISPTSSSSLSS